MGRVTRAFLEGVALMILASLVGVGWNAVRPSGGIPLTAAATRQVADDELGVPDGAADPEAELVEIGLDRMQKAVDGGEILLLDARASSEFVQGHIPGALNLPYDEFLYYYDLVMSDIPKDRRIICYCISRDCDLSHDLADQLLLMGYSRVSVYTGGFQEWLENDLPYQEGEEVPLE
jgi:rhodanese-related sulfurtransferase